MALNVVSSERLSTNVKTSNLATILSGKVGSSKNLIINGAMNVAQRATTKSTHTAAGFFTVDRIYTSIGGEDEGRTEAQITLTSSDTGPWAKGFRNAFQITNGNQSSAVGADDYQNIVIKNEAQYIANSGWDYTSASSYITFSFWVKSSVAQNFYGFLKTQDGTQQYYTFETGSLSANTWTKITKTIPGNSNITVDNNNGEGLSIEILPFLGTTWTDTRTLNTWSAWDANKRTPNNTTTWWETDNATFAITGLQLEVGDTATEFEHTLYGDELLKCKRYCHVMKGDSNDMTGAVGWCGGSDGGFPYTLPVPMRALPSFTGSGTWRLNCPGGNGADQTSNLAWQNDNLTFDAGWFYLSSVSTASSAGQAAFLQFRGTGTIFTWSAEL